MNKMQAQHAFDAELSGLKFSEERQRQVFAKIKRKKARKKLPLSLVLAAVLTLAAAAALSASIAYYERVGFVDSPTYDKWSVWLGGDAFLPELDRIDALVDRLSDGLYEEDAIMDAAAKANPDVNATEKKALRTALYALWKVADPDFFSLDTFEPSDYSASVSYAENGGAGVWHVRLNPARDSGLRYYYVEVSAMNNQLIRIHKLSEDGAQTLKIIYFGVVEVDYDEFIAMGQSG